MTDYQSFNEERKNETIKDIKSISQLVSSFYLADAILEIREERKDSLNSLSKSNIPTLNTTNPIMLQLFADFAKLVNYRYPFLYMAKIGFEDMMKYEFHKDASVMVTATTDTSHLSNSIGSNFTLLKDINLLDHTLNVFKEGLYIGKSKGRAMQIAIPLLGCLFHDFGKSTKIRDEILGVQTGKGYRAHAEVSSLYIKDVLSLKYHNLVNEDPIETLSSLAYAVGNHHPQQRKQTNDTVISIIIEADFKARKNEYNMLQKRLKNN